MGSQLLTARTNALVLSTGMVSLWSCRISKGSRVSKAKANRKNMHPLTQTQTGPVLVLSQKEMRLEPQEMKKKTKTIWWRSYLIWSLTGQTSMLTSTQPAQMFTQRSLSRSLAPMPTRSLTLGLTWFQDRLQSSRTTVFRNASKFSDL